MSRETESDLLMAIIVLSRSLYVALAVQVYVTIYHHAAASAIQILYPGIVVDFNCNVASPFIHVNDIERTPERGFDGYVEDLRALGIEAKDLSPNDSFIPLVCANGSSTELRNASTISITLKCQDIQQDRNFQTIYIHRFTFTLTYRSQLPAPTNVRMSDNMLEWSRPPCVTNSSSDTYSIEVTHTLEYTYTIYITVDGTTTTITVSTTSYNLSDMLQPCSEYSIEVSACNSETMPCEDMYNERSPPITFTMPGCPVNPNPPVSEDTVSTISPPATEQEDGTKQTTGISLSIMIVIIVAGVVLVLCVLITCGIVSVFMISYSHMKTQKKNKNNNNNNNNNNNMVGTRVSTQPAPVYEEVIEPQCSVEMKENVAYGPINKTK